MKKTLKESSKQKKNDIMARLHSFSDHVTHVASSARAVAAARGDNPCPVQRETIDATAAAVAQRWQKQFRYNLG